METMVLYFYGHDTYCIQQESLSERERFFGDGVMQNVRKFDASDRGEFRWSAFVEAARDEGLFSQKRCVIVDNIASLTEDEREKMRKWIDSERAKNEDVLCIFTDNKPDKRTALFKALQKNARSQEFTPLSGVEVVRFAHEWVRKRNARVSFGAGVIEAIAEGCGSDLFRLENELEKLSAWAGEGGTVTLEQVREMSEAGVFEEVFGALDALGNGDKKNALRLLRRQLRRGEHAIKLLSTCAYQIRTMLLVGECLQNGVSDPGMVSREAKIHPFVAKKTIACMRTFGMMRAQKAFALLGRFDIAVKTGKMDAELAVEEFVLRS